MHNLLDILIFTLRNFTKLPILRYLGICNVLHIWHIQAIPTYRVYQLYDKHSESKGTVCVCVCVCLKEKKRGLGVMSVRRIRTGGYIMLFYNGVYYIILHNAAEYSVAIGSSPNFQCE